MNDWVWLRICGSTIQYVLEVKCVQDLSHLKAAYKKKRIGDQGSSLKEYAAATCDLPLGLTSSAKRNL